MKEAEKETRLDMISLCSGLNLLLLFIQAFNSDLYLAAFFARIC